MKKKVDGIIFLGSYPADDFSTKSIPMLSIYGEVDALATVEKIENNKKVDVKEYNYAHDKRWKPCSFWHVW